MYDFQGPYFVESDRMMLGRATRYLQLDPSKVGTDALEGETIAERWDRLVAKVSSSKLYPNAAFLRTLSTNYSFKLFTSHSCFPERSVEI